MSIVDERVVEMRFDNADFERNVQTSLGTLDKLKKALNLNPDTSGLEKINGLSANMDFSAMRDGVEAVRMKFSALEVMAITALTNITNKAVDAGMSLVKSLSLDQITAGMNKYEQKTTAVQTIMSATSRTWEEEAKAANFAGTQMEFVDEQLEKLNWFSDETSYSFTDMTSNIGKFTSNGVGLQDSVQAMEGISSWAAKSGQNTQAASRAMYNLAQALSVGSVKLIDWKSIENANMATQEFKQTVLDTAVELGAMEKAEDGVYKSASGAEVSVTNFNEDLKKGWFTSEVLMATLKKYGAGAQRLSEITNEYDTTASKFLKGMDDYAEGNKSMDQIAREVGISASELKPLFEELSAEEYKLGISSFKAAQEAKTFTEAIDATKDAVSTGWMTTFETIFGNYEEAKVLWTDLANTLWDIFAAGGEVRNEILGIWKEHGGRDNLIQSFKNLYAAITALIAPIKEAFDQIFPSTVSKSAAKLITFTYRLREFTAGLKISDETADKIKRTFAGVFAVLDIVKRAFSAVVSGIIQIATALLPLGNGFLGVTSSVGDFLVGLDDTVKKTDIFKKVIDGVVQFLIGIPQKIDSIFQQITGSSIGDAFGKIADTIKGAIDKIKGFFEEFGKIDFGGVDKFKSDTEQKLNPIKKLFDGLKKIFGGLWEFLKKLAPVLGTVVNTVGEILGNLGNRIKEGVKNMNLDTFGSLLGGGILLAIGGKFTGFVDNLKKTSSGFTGIFDSIKEVFGNLAGTFGSIKGVLDGVKDCFVAWQKDLQAKTLIKIAAAIAILTASLFVLSTIDPNKLGSALTAMGAEFVLMIKSMESLANINSKGLMKTAGALLLVSVAMLILSSACKKLADLDWEGIFKGVVGVAALSVIMTKVAKSLSKDGGQVMKGTVGLIAFAIAIKLLVDPVKKLSELSWEELGKGLAGVGALCAEIAAFLKFSDLDGIGVTKGLGLMALAVSIGLLAKSVEKFSSMDTDAMKQGLIGVGAVLAEVGLFTKLTSGTKGLIGTSIGMALLAASMLIFASAIEKMGSIDPQQLAIGLGAMAGVLVEVGIAMNLFPKDILGKSVGLLVAAAAITVLSNALKSMSGMSWEEIAKGLVAMGGALGELAIALNFMNGTLGGSAALLVAAVALGMFVPVIKTLGSMDFNAVLIALIAMAGTFVVLAAGAMALGPVIPVVFGLSAAIALLGGGLILLGAGLGSVSAGILALATSAATAAKAIDMIGKAGDATGAGLLAFATKTLIEVVSMIGKAIIGFIPALVVSIAEGIVQIIEVIGNSAASIAKTIVQVGSAALKALSILIPQFLDFIVKLLLAIQQKAPIIVETVVRIITSLLNSIRTHAGEITSTVVDTIIAVIRAITDRIPDIIQAGIDLIFGLIEGLGQGIEDNAEKLRETMVSFCEHIINAVKNFLGINSPSTKFIEIAEDIVNGLIEGIGKKIEEFKNKLKELIDQGIQKVKEKFGEWKEAAKEMITNVINGVHEKIEEFKTKVTELIDKGKEVVSNKVSEWKDEAVKLIGGIIEGVGSKIEEFKTKCEEIINAGKKAIEDKVKDFITIGENIAKGLVEGIKGGVKLVADAGSRLINAARGASEKEAEVQSPSKVYKRIGRYLCEGLIIGMDEYRGKVAKSSRRMAEAAIDSCRNTVSDIAQMIEDGVESPIITPVVDTSQIGNGVRSIADIFNSSSYQIPFNADLGKASAESQMFNAMKNAMADVNKESGQTINGGVNVYVYGAEGQDPVAVADAVEQRLLVKFDRLRAARA